MLFESVQYHPVSTLNLAIGPRVSYGDVPNVDPAILAVRSESVVVKIRTQICDDAIGEAIAVNQFIQEVEYSISLWAGDRLDFDQLGKLVDGHQDSVESSWRSR